MPLATLALAAYLLTAPCSQATCLLHILVTIVQDPCDHHDHEAPCDTDDSGVCLEHAHQVAHVPARPAAPAATPARMTHDRPSNDGRPDLVCVPVFVPPKVTA